MITVTLASFIKKLPTVFARTVCHWYVDIKRGNQSLKMNPNADGPVVKVNPENIEKVISVNRQVSLPKIAHKTRISRTSIQTIIHEHVGMSKVLVLGPENFNSSNEGYTHGSQKSTFEMLQIQPRGFQAQTC